MFKKKKNKIMDKPNLENFNYPEVIYEDEILKINKADKVGVGLVIIRNKTNKKLFITFENEELKNKNFSIPGNNFVGIINNKYGRLMLEEILNNRIVII